MGPLSAHTKLMSELTRRKFLSFKILELEYVIDILSVVGFHAYEKPTPIDAFLPTFEGVVFINRKAIPIVKLHSREAKSDGLASIILMNVRDQVIGLVVDKVLGVIALSEDDLSPLNKFDENLHTKYISAIKGIEGRFLLLFNSDALHAIPP